jgi:hypothetical protein
MERDQFLMFWAFADGDGNCVLVMNMLWRGIKTSSYDQTLHSLISLVLCSWSALLSVGLPASLESTDVESIWSEVGVFLDG